MVDESSMAARRTTAGSTPYAFAIPSCTSASIAPCRRSPSTSPRRNACSRSVARPNRSAANAERRLAEPDPDRPAMDSKVASTCRSVSDATVAAVGQLGQPSPAQSGRR